MSFSIQAIKTAFLSKFPGKSLRTELSQDRQWIDKAMGHIKSFMTNNYTDQMSAAYFHDFVPPLKSPPKPFQEKLTTKRQAMKNELSNAIANVNGSLAATLFSLQVKKVFLTEEIDALSISKKRFDRFKLKSRKQQYAENELKIKEIENLLNAHNVTPAMFKPTAENPLTDYRILYLVYHHTGATCKRTGDGVLAYKISHAFENFLKQNEDRLTLQQEFLKQALNAFSAINSCAANIKRLETSLNKNPIDQDSLSIYFGFFLTEYPACLQMLTQLAVSMTHVIDNQSGDDKVKLAKDTLRPDKALQELVAKQSLEFETLKTKITRIINITEPVASKEISPERFMNSMAHKF